MFYKIVRKLAFFLTKVLFFLRIKSIENIPASGGAVICANHRSFWDVVLLAASIKRPLAFIGKEELFENKLLGFVFRKLNCYPVRRGGGDFAVVKTAVSLLRNDQLMVIFPEGERIRKGKKPHPKAGALRIAIMSGVPVIPVGIKGNFKWFRKMEVVAGEAIDTSVYKGQKYTEEEYNAMIWEIMDKIYSLAETEYLHD